MSDSPSDTIQARAINQTRVEITFPKPVHRDGDFYNTLSYGLIPAVPIQRVESAAEDRAVLVLGSELAQAAVYEAVVALRVRFFDGTSLAPGQNKAEFEGRVDSVRPTVVAIEPLDEFNIRVRFSEPMDRDSLEGRSTYEIRSRVTGQRVEIGGVSPEDDQTVQLHLGSRQSNGALHDIYFHSLRDTVGNSLEGSGFSYLGSSALPRLLEASIDGVDQELNLVFDAPMTPAAARQSHAFRISNEENAEPIYIDASRPGSRSETVVLTISAMTDGAEYEVLATTELWDRWGNAVDPANNRTTFQGVAAKPVLRSVSARTPQVVELEFSKAMKSEGDVLSTESYTIDPLVQIHRVLSVEGTVVRLLTSTLHAGFGYSLACNAAILDVGSNPLELPVQAAFDGPAGSSVVPEFPIDLYSYILGGIRSVDEESGTFFLKRFLEPITLFVRDMFERLLGLRSFRDPLTCDEELLPMLARTVGWPDDLVPIVLDQPVSRQREIIRNSPQLWRRRGALGSVADVVETVFAKVALERDEPYKKLILDDQLFEEYEKSSDPYLSDERSSEIILQIEDSRLELNRQHVMQLVNASRSLNQSVRIVYFSKIERLTSNPIRREDTAKNQSYSILQTPREFLLFVVIEGGGRFGVDLNHGVATANRIRCQIDFESGELALLKGAAVVTKTFVDMPQDWPLGLRIHVSRTVQDDANDIEVQLDGERLLEARLPGDAFEGDLRAFHRKQGRFVLHESRVLPLPAVSDVVEPNFRHHYGHVG